MARIGSRYSIFAQRLDRAVFLAYFLGAVVPLVALGWFFVVPALGPTAAVGGRAAGAEGLGQASQLALMMSAGILCLGSFFLLRRFAQQTLVRLTADRERLARLVEVSSALGEAPHAGEVARGAAAAALTVAQADAAYVFLAEKDAPPALAEHAGAGAEDVYRQAARAVDAMVRLALEGGRPAVVGEERGGGAAGGLVAGAAVPLVRTEDRRAALVAVRTRSGGGFDAQQVDVLCTLAAMAGVAVHNADLRDAQQNFFAHVTELVVSALDAYLDLQVGHSRRVAHYANAMGREVGLGEGRLQKLHFASLLHDVGMLRIDRDHWALPAAHRKHPAIGARMLERIRLWEDIAPFVLHHHEWWNGEGYPEGLAGEAIPREARIIGIAEAFDSMLTAGYRARLDPGEALRRIEEGAGTQFDPDLAAVFARLVRDGTVRVDAPDPQRRGG